MYLDWSYPKDRDICKCHHPENHTRIEGALWPMWWIPCLFCKKKGGLKNSSPHRAPMSGARRHLMCREIRKSVKVLSVSKHQTKNSPQYGYGCHLRDTISTFLELFHGLLCLHIKTIIFCKFTKGALSLFNTICYVL